MKHIFHILLSAMTLLSATTCVGYLSEPSIMPVRYVIPESSRIAIINNVFIENQIISSAHPEGVMILKENIIRSVYNSGKFAAVYIKEAPELDPGTEVVYLDIKLKAGTRSMFEWYSYFAVYPLPGIWPLSTRYGCTRFLLESTITGMFDDKNMVQIAGIRAVGTSDYYSRFYSHLKKHMIDESAARSLELTLNRFTHHLQKVNYSKNKDVQQFQDPLTKQCNREAREDEFSNWRFLK